MSDTIDYGIDLGTTNSLIGCFTAGRVEVYKNPRGHKEGLPSVVGFRNEKILIGDRAKDFSAKDPKNVVNHFKRKMGTSETFNIESTGNSITPVELSSFVLKELKSFVHTGAKIDSAVITIPASFDTIQSNATKEAGIQVGFSEVLLLQEPIAASLAYANQDKSEDLKNSQWIVYDLGGGTFDVALVKIIEGEMTIVDHEGDNYFGGTDFDSMIVEKIVVPFIEKKGKFTDLLKSMKSASGRYEKDWYQLLHAAEEAKIELSSDTSTEIEYEIEDEDGQLIDVVVTITRSQFEELIQDKITESISMLKKIVTRKSLQPQDLEFVLMVGGSTWIPFVRNHVEEVMGIPVNTKIDPINAIVVGASFFAGTRKMKDISRKIEAYNIKVRAVYERNTQELEEIFAARIEGDIDGMHYRIHSLDGTYDSNLKPLATRISEDLPLREGDYNVFEFNIVDKQGNRVEHGSEQIQISQGRYTIAGQVLPNEICLVTDDPLNRDTKLNRIFQKNAVLPTESKSSVEVAKTVVKGSTNEIKLIIVEGSSQNHHLSNKPIGTLKITGEMINRDLLKGSEIDLTFNISESRDLTISAYVEGIEQEFSQVFNPQKREVHASELGQDVLRLESLIMNEQVEAEESDSSDLGRELGVILNQVQTLMLDAGQLSEDSVTDEKFQLEDKKRDLANQVHQLTANKRLNAANASYQEEKESVMRLIQKSGNDHEEHRAREVISREEVFLRSDNVGSIELAESQLSDIRMQILYRTPAFLRSIFERLVENRVSMNDPVQAKNLIENGRNLIEKESWDDLSIVIDRLWELMPDTQRSTEEDHIFTGII
jgi:molecular chaperone DnaK